MKLVTIFCVCILAVTADHTKFCRNKEGQIGGRYFTLSHQQPTETASIIKCRPEMLRKQEKIELKDYENVMEIDGSYMDVGNEKVDIIKDDTFSNLNKLKRLFVTQVDLEKLEPHAFRGLKALEELSLYRNKLSSLPAGIFDDVPNLTALNLEDNKITKIDEHLFDKLNKLEYLTLALNDLTALPTNWAKGLTSLKALSLNTNQLNVLTPGMFAGLTNLESLSLDVNGMEKIEKDAFKGMDKLEGLSMIYNKGIEAGMENEMKHLQNLKTFSLSPNNFDCKNYKAILEIANSKHINLQSLGESTC